MTKHDTAQYRLFLGIFCLTSLACAGARPKARTASPAPQVAAGISRTLLDHHDLPNLSGWEERLYLIEYGPGVAAPVHHHPVEGLGYVVSGSFESAFADEAPTRVTAGQSFRERALTPHVLFRNPDSSRPLVFVIAFVVRQGVPVTETP